MPTNANLIVKTLVAILFTFSANYSTLAENGDKSPSGITIVADSSSSYQIVVPDGEDLRDIIGGAASALREYIAEATGCELPIVKEAEADPDKGGIFLGDTRAAGKAGVEARELKINEFVKKAFDGDIFLAGFDDPAEFVRNRKDAAYRGTLKAVASFLEDEVGVRFLLPGPNGVHVPKIDSLAVSAGLDYRGGENAPFTSGNPRDIYYTANNHRNYWFFKTYGGHSYYDAVPKEKYAATNPEYFALSGGERVSDGNHLCISNPEVQELMVAEMDKWFEMGYLWYELAQTDGYRPCECESCQAMGGGDPGEALWILHRELAAEALLKWPDRKVVIIAYGPTKEPPKSFESFPANVIIEMTTYTPEHFAKYAKFDLEKMVYIYNWGTYQTLGFLPKRTPAFVGDQIRLFAANRVRAIYKCGFGENMGLEGPVYYVWGKMLLDPAASPFDLADDFYRAAYGRARTPMKAFFDNLYKNLELYSNIPESPDTRSPGALIIPRTPEATIAAIFTPGLIVAMQDNLDEALSMDNDPRVQARLRLVEREFAYLRNIVSIFTYYRAYRLSDSWTSFDLLEKELSKRTELIDSWFTDNPALKRNPKAPPYIMRVDDGWPAFFGNTTKSFLTQGGRLTGLLTVPPFSWNMEQLRQVREKHGPQAFKNRSLTISRLPGDIAGAMPAAAQWAEIEPHELSEIGLGQLHEETSFKVAYDDENIYIAFSCDTRDPAAVENHQAYGRDGSCYVGECLEVMVDPYGTREKYYHFIVGPVPNSYYDARNGFITDELDPRYGRPDKSWNGEWSYEPRVDAAAGEWTAQIKIPFATLGVPAPQKGERWTMNFAREALQSVPGSDAKRQELSTWSPNLEERSFHAPHKFGNVTFD